MTIEKTEIFSLSEDEWKALEAVQRMIESAQVKSETLCTKDLLADFYEKILLFKKICRYVERNAGKRSDPHGNGTCLL